MMDKRCCRLSKGVEINLDIAMRYVFGDYLLDTQRYELSYRNQPIKLRPKVFHVLSYLIAHRDRVVSKDELLEQVWPNQFIGDGSYRPREGGNRRRATRGLGDAVDRYGDNSSGNTAGRIQYPNRAGNRYVASRGGDARGRAPSTHGHVL